jgi:hypothetical protein
MEAKNEDYFVRNSARSPLVRRRVVPVFLGIAGAVFWRRAKRETMEAVSPNVASPHR